MKRSLPMTPDAEQVSPASRSTADDEPGFGGLRTDRGHLPMEAMDVRGRIDGLLARVVLRQMFVNAFDEPLEASYIFPMPDRAAVTGFRMIVAGREVEGVLEERGRARKDYAVAVAEGRRASIAEEDRPGVFNLRVGNLMPGEKATVELTLCGILPYCDGEATFRFPLVVAPRYIPGRPLPGPSVGDGTAVDTDAVPDASRITPPVLLPGFPNPVRLSIQIELHDGGARADEVHSSLHAVFEEERDGYRRIRIQPGERLDRDFILRFRLGGPGICSTLSLHPDADDRQRGTFAMTIVPPASVGIASRPRDVVFVLDRSGSMAGWKIVAARRALARMIDTLGDADRFAVLTFDTVVEMPDGLPRGLAPGVDRHRFRAVEYLAGVDARGGTEMAEPLDRAVKLLSASGAEDRDRVLVLITDGQVGNEDQILATLGRRLEKIRVFTIGIDRAVNEAFLRRLAEQGGGACELVESEDRLDDVMTAIHRRIGTPILSGLVLEPHGFSIEPGEIVPRRLPDLFAGSPVLILGRYQGAPQGSIDLHARGAAGAPYSESVTPVVRENPAIAAAWARGQIRQLEDRYAAREGREGSLEKAIVALSLRHRVLCRLTAYVAIDRSQVVNEGGVVHRITQPVEMPQGWDPSRIVTRGSYGGGGGGERCAAPSPTRGVKRRLASPSFFSQADLAAPAPSAEALPPPSCAPIESREPSEVTPESLGGLAFALRSGPRLAPEEVAALVLLAAEGLGRLHDQGLVYGEMDPSKVRLAGEEWGASMSLADAVLWCSLCRAPERLETPDSERTEDVYLLGVILYELLTGRMLGSTVPVIRPREIDPAIPGGLQTICLKAMARVPRLRYASARRLAEALAPSSTLCGGVTSSAGSIESGRPLTVSVA